jgi:hypothetical protein
MINRIKQLIFLLLISLPVLAQSEKRSDYGASFAMDLEKDLNRFFSLNLEEEIRLVSRSIGFDRSVTAFGLDYAIFDRRLKFSIYYAFMYLYNNDQLYEPRHRSYFNISYKETLESFTLSWRGRLQGTYRNENRGRYKINPKYGMKNKFQIDYSIWGSPWKPFISCDISCDLNDPMGNGLTRFRYQSGVSWRLNRTDYLEFFARYDQYTLMNEVDVLAIGIAYKVKL